ncbi:unnamed protein product [Microthlaspi erraticum]|uniref:NPH3 domain-containing protein n=1 Tax=Microthlaspi erraticum TaxID=1685480 RepID=A0A6D2INF9_9BRAS|nr:unnamed protein product [Microthlaspi erraticum]
MNSESADLKSSGVGTESTDADKICNKRIVVPHKVVTLANNFEKKDRSWYVKSKIPNDLSIQVDDITFHAHKFPLISKCGYISNNIELQASPSEDIYHLKLENFPGGAETFETILKFCYGLPLDLTPLNVAPLRCASEYLYMTEEFEDGNLISKTEAFITFVVLSSWRDTLTVLKSCASLSPWSENLQIVRRCCDLLAWKACKDNNNIPEDDVVDSNNERCLFNDLATLQIDHFMRVVTSVKARRAKPEIIGRIIVKYAEKWLPLIDEDLEGVRVYGLGKNELQFSVNRVKTEHQEQKGIIESIVSVLPTQSGAVSCKFLLRLLKTAMVYSASPALISDLEKRVGMALEDADVCDLLIPNFKKQDQQKGASSLEVYAMYNVDVVYRILEYFFMHEQQQQQQELPGKPSITKLLDSYLAEIAKDPCLPITKFQVLAEALPENAWKCHDGLYRAIDMFFKTHPLLSEHEIRRLCKTMNCEKLSLDACLHAAQNDRLPLRTIVQINTQVLFSEQVKMRMMMQDKKPETTKEENSGGREDERVSRDDEIKTLKEDLDNVKKKMAELQNDYSELQQEYEALSSKQKSSQNWGMRWQKMKKSFQTKHEDDETRDRSRRSSTGPRTSFRRRMSTS